MRGRAWFKAMREAAVASLGWWSAPVVARLDAMEVSEVNRAHVGLMAAIQSAAPGEAVQVPGGKLRLAAQRELARLEAWAAGAERPAVLWTSRRFDAEYTAMYGAEALASLKWLATGRLDDDNQPEKETMSINEQYGAAREMTADELEALARSKRAAEDMAMSARTPDPYRTIDAELPRAAYERKERDDVRCAPRVERASGAAVHRWSDEFATIATATPAMRPMDQALSELDRQVTRANEELAELRKKLFPALRGVPTKAVQAEAARIDFDSPVLQAIALQSDRVYGLMERIAELRNEVEL